MKSLIISIIFYSFLLVSAVFSLKLLPHIPYRYLPVFELAPFVLLFISFVLGLKFNRSQLIFSSILFALIYAYFFWLPVSEPQKHYLILNSMTLFLAVNVVLIAFYSERGLFNLVGISRLLIISLTLIGLVWLVEKQFVQWQQIIYQAVIPELKIELLFFSQMALLSVFSSFIIVSFLFLLKGNPFRIAIFSSMILVLYGITFSVNDMSSIAILFSWAMFIPLITMVSESYRMAYLDELTGLPGRRALNENLNKLGSKYVIAMLDVDHFKKFNDTYGHDAGDDVLRLLGNRLKSISGGGKPFRYGGEEFTVVFSGLSTSDAAKHLEKLRESVANKKFALRKQGRRKGDKKASKQKKNREVKVTISIGYAERNDKTGTTTQVLKAADKALYRAKRKGRNCLSL